MDCKREVTGSKRAKASHLVFRRIATNVEILKSNRRQGHGYLAICICGRSS